MWLIGLAKRCDCTLHRGPVVRYGEITHLFIRHHARAHAKHLPTIVKCIADHELEMGIDVLRDLLCNSVPSDRPTHREILKNFMPPLPTVGGERDCV